MQFAGYTNTVCSYVESNSVRLVADDDDTTSAVSPTRRGAQEKTYGMRNRRLNVYAYLPVRRGRGVKEKEWTDCVQSDIRAFGITGDWKATASKAEVWVETVAEGGRRFMATGRK